jgi:hypothetical protein
MKKIILILFAALLLAGCGKKIVVKKENAAKLCELASAAFKNQKYELLYREIEAEFGVNKEDITIRDEGVYIRLKKGFASEEGVLISHRDLGNAGPGKDPSYEKLSHCLYIYRVKG